MLMLIYFVFFFQLPIDLQERLKCHLTRDQVIALEDSPPGENGENAPAEQRMIRVPMPTFPPTAMVYSVPKQEAPPPVRAPATVPTTLIARVLTQPTVKHKPRKIYFCNRCHTDTVLISKETQTTLSHSDTNGYSDHRNGNKGKYPQVHRPRLMSTESEV